MQPNKLKITNDDQNIELSEAGARGYTTLSVNKGKSEIRVRAYFNATFEFRGDVTNVNIGWLDLRCIVNGKWADYPNTNNVCHIKKLLKNSLVEQSVDWYCAA